MLEVDEDSRLGRELMAGGARYHAHFVPDEEITATLFETACERLEAAGARQYEISNFAQAGHESRHNLKYWTRQPYLGFGVDAHSMLRCSGQTREAVRFASPDLLEEYVAGAPLKRIPVSSQAALEEFFFLGLRLAQGVDLKNSAADFGESAVQIFSNTILDCVAWGLLERDGDVIRLTRRGRLLSNEVFECFIGTANASRR
jgi:oxygen-independent coproporphyrinogen-3 oxidase